MKKIGLSIVTLLFMSSLYAQILTPVKWSYAAKKTGKNEATVYFKATIEPDWHIYSLNVGDGGPIKTSFTFAPSKQFTLVGKVMEPTPVKKFEKAFNMNVTYFENAVIFQQKIKLNANQATVKGKLEYMTCNDQKCLPPEELDFSIAVK
ncbi:protein-disulfide reductase DsbD N-terminal domain-containing protein [Mucilaginibacter sp. HMF5004]|uniref:protein-disulfide reductase DsbD N-terminal domain-containing protein n=1 Tax=Mucilaginibacter rivuli TaxID=2857527 RepID=UPI001C5CDCAB|nr:protein-disulfide reductase DsbD N-terminal domain-containing protein [Mucilaginibacter rivuli]MBW4890348.1 protein-disulfide reductase DsbD N-terminal domain-containing protein [Mucilaginibacter rivuli]